MAHGKMDNSFKTGKIKLPIWVKAGFLAAFVIIVVASAFFLRLQKQVMLSRAEKRLSAISRLKVDQIEAWRKDQLDHGTEIAARRDLVEQLNRWLLDPHEHARQRLLSELKLVCRQKRLINILLVDANGAVRLDLPGPEEDPDSLAVESAAAFSKRMPVMTDLHQDSRYPKPHLSIVVPLFADNARTQPIGAVILMLDPSDYLYPFIQSWPIPSQSAESLLVRREGNHVLFLNPLRHKADTALKLRIPLNQSDLPAAMVIKGTRGVVFGKDYRGEKVVAVVRAIKDSPWFMIAKVDEDEVFKDWRFLATLILTLVVGALAILGLLALFAWQRTQKNHYLALLKAEKDLFHSEKNYRELVEAANSIIMRLDNQGIIRFINAFGLRFFGYTREELMGRDVMTLVPKIQSSSGRVLTNLSQEVLDHPERHMNVPNENITKDGRIVWVVWTNKAIVDEKGIVQQILSIGNDITALKKAEEALREKLLEYGAIFEHSVVGKAEADPATGRFLKVNRAFADMLGYTPAELCRMTPLDITHPDDRAHKVPGLEALRTGSVNQYQHEKRYLKKDGSVIWVNVAGNLIRFDDGRPSRTIAVIQDITERKHAEEARRISDEKFASAFHGNVVALSLSRLSDSTPIEVNDRWLDLFGFKRAEVIGKPISEKTWQSPEDRAQMARQLEQSGFFQDREVQFRRSTGEIWAGLVSARVVNIGGVPVLVTSVIDITDRKRKNELLQGINRILETVVTSVSDEDFGTACLEVAEKNTGSSISFVAEFGPGGLMHDIAVSNPTWSVCSIYDRQRQDKLPDNLHIRGLCRSVFSEGVTLVANDPVSHPEGTGLPPGHPPLTSFMGGPLKQQDNTIGMLAVGNREGGYGPQEQQTLEILAQVIVETLARRRAESALKASLAEKEVLLKEIHHRVKNNMQVISSLVDLQANEVNDPAMRHIFQDIVYRVRSMAMVHEKLYQSTDLARVDFADYANTLLGYLWRAQGTALAGVELKLELASVWLPVNHAVPCGLILNELFTNALKHAFVNRDKGKVTVSLGSDAPDRISLSVGDDGIGLPPETDLKGARSLGLRLVQMLAGQLHAAVQLHQDHGTKFTIIFEVPQP